MTLTRRLADQLLNTFPERATLALERLSPGETTEILARLEPESAIGILRRLSPHHATAALAELRAEQVAGLLKQLPIELCARLLRRMSDGRRDELLRLLPRKTERDVRGLLRFREGTAGALLDPNVLALAHGLTAGEALARVREDPKATRYNLYIVDQEQRLVGALNLRELFLADPDTPIAELMVNAPHRIAATADRAAVVAHPGWRDVHALPVVDVGGEYLGAIRYRTLRDLEASLLARRGKDADAGAAIGEIISAGARGLLDAFAGSAGEGDRSA